MALHSVCDSPALTNDFTRNVNLTRRPKSTTILRRKSICSMRASSMVLLHVSQSVAWAQTSSADYPFQAFPDEDKIEYEVMEAQRRIERLQSGLNAESQAADLLARAAVTMDRCQASMSEALQYSRYGEF